MAALEATKEEADQVLNTEQPGEDLEATLQAEYAAGGWAEAGNADFQTFCMPCHAADGGGTIGPNFTDDYYIHGGRLTDIMNTIINGVPEKGMISWKASLKPEQIKNLTFYIRSLRGTTPAVAKDPQGRKVDEAGNFIEEEAE
jgi:cytochrome c oxidase cbb3-type subunit 3